MNIEQLQIILDMNHSIKLVFKYAQNVNFYSLIRDLILVVYITVLYYINK